MKQWNRQAIQERARKPYSPWWDTLMIWVDTVIGLLQHMK